jgi:cell division septation protein DedD
MPNGLKKGANLPHRSISSFMAISLVLLFAACKKKEPPAVIEEVPAAAAPVETDTSATLTEEPSLKKVGEENKTPQHSPAAQQAGFSDHGPFVVQVSVFKGKRQAANLVEKLANQGFPAYVAEVENPTAELSGTWHRVRIGRFARIADARSFGENTLRGMGYDFWVDNKKNDKVGAGEGSYSATPSEPAAPRSRVESAPPAAPSVPSEPAPPAATGETWGAPKPDEPAAPAGDAWGTPKTEPAPSEPAAPAGDAWGTPKTDQPASGSATKTGTDKKKTETPPNGKKAPGDTGKVNLDEW